MFENLFINLCTDLGPAQIRAWYPPYAHFAVAKTINYENNYPCGRYDAGLRFGLILRSGCR